MAPHMAASLAPSMTLPPSLSLTLLHPLIAPQGSHQPLLPLLSLCLSPSVFVCLLACLPPSISHYFHQSFFSLSRAVRLQLHTQGYADMTKRGRKYMLEHTHAHLHKLTFHISLPHCLASPSRFFKKVTVFPLWIPLILFHTTVESFAFQIKKIKKALQKNKNKKKKTHSLADWHTIQTQKGKAKLWLLKQLEVKQVAVYYIEQRSPDSISNTIILK